MKLNKKELAKALVKELNLDDNIFNYQAVAEEIELLQENQYMDFYKEVMSRDSFGNGLKVIMQVVQDYKPKTKSTDERAKKLIHFAESMNSELNEMATARGVDFVKLVQELKPKDKYIKTFSVLNHVKPYNNAKELIINIRRFQNGNDALRAFNEAIISYDNYLSNTQTENMLQGKSRKELFYDKPQKHI